MSSHSPLRDIPPIERDSERPAAAPSPALRSPVTVAASMPPVDKDATLAPSEASGPAVLGEIPAVPGYEIIAELGRGGMGVVYQARQTKLNRLVALKMVLHGNHASSADLDRFLAEGEAVAQLQHANIVQIHEIGQQGGLPFFSLEYVEGGTLAQRLQRGPLPPSEAAQLTETLARAMAYAHGRGLIHRDLKPSNVLLAADGTPKITDFGLAKRLDGEPGVSAPGGLTVTGAIVGTPNYMAPEQAGAKKDITALCDVYALGALLYEMLTGRPPFQAPTPIDTVFRVLTEEPVPPRRLQPKLPRDLETICLKCLQKEPYKRYASAMELADDLGCFREDRPIVARPVSRLERGWRWCRRNPSLAALSATAVLLVVLVATVSTAAYLRTSAALSREAESRSDAIREQAEAVRERDQANRNLYTSLLGEVRALRLARVEGYRSRAWELLGQARRLQVPNRDVDELRQEAVACLGDFVGLPPLIRQELPTGARGFALQPDGEWLAVALGDGVLLRDLHTGADRGRLLSPGATVNRVTFAPNGTQLLAGHTDGTVMLWQLDPSKGTGTGNALTRLAAPVYALRWTANGRRLACGLVATQAIIRDLDESADVILSAEGRNLDGPAAFGPRGELVAVACHQDNGESGLLLWELGARKLRGFLDTGLGRVFDFDFSPDGTRLACACTEGVAVFDTSGLRRVWFVRCDEPFAVAFSSDGRTLAYCASQDGAIRLWNLVSNRERAVLNLAEAARFIAFDASGQTLLAAGGRRLRGWALQPAERRALGGHNSGVEGMAFSPDGKLLVSPSIDRTAKVWDAAAGTPIGTLDGYQETTRVVAFTPDGRLLAVGSADAKALVRFWDLATWQEQPLLGKPLDWVDRTYTRQVWVISFSPDGEHMVVGGDGIGLTLWHSARPTNGGLRPPFQQVARLFDQSVTAATFSPDGRSLAWLDRNAVLRLYDMQKRRSVPGPAAPLAWHIRSLAFSPDSLSLLFLDQPHQNLVRWHLADGRQETVLPHARFERSRNTMANGLLAATADGSWIALSARSVTVWDVARGELLLALPEELTAVYCIAWSPDRRRLAVGTSDGSLSIWDIPTIRTQLAEIGLDWDAPDYPPAPPPQPPLRPFKVIDGPAQQPIPPEPPSIVLNAGAKRRSATPEQIANWVKQLADKDAKSRDEAEKALEEVGPPAAKALGEAASHADAAGRERIKRVLDRIAVAEALAPRRVSLKVKDAPLADVLKEWSAKTGVRATYTPRPGTNTPPNTVTLELDGVPVLEALDRLGEAAGLVATGPDGWGLIPGKPAARGSLAYGGPFRMKATSMLSSRQVGLQGEKPSPEQLLLRLSLGSEAGTAVLRHGQARVREAVDDSGHDLRPVTVGAPGSDGDAFSAVETSSLSVRLALPPKHGGTLKHLKIVLPVEVAARRDLLTATYVPKDGAKTFSSGDGLQFTVQAVTILSLNSVLNSIEVQFTVSVPEDRTLDPKTLGLRWIDAKGKAHQTPDFAIDSSPQMVQGPKAGHRRQWSGSARFNTPEALGSPVLLTLFRVETLRTEVPFEFHDLPLL